MNDRAASIAFIFAGAAAWFWSRQSAASVPVASSLADAAGETVDAVGDAVASLSAGVVDAAQGVGDVIQNTIGGAWDIPARGEKYRAAIYAAEDRYGIPRLLLARLLYQECRFRDDIITGRVRSSAGALGIAQFMPATAADLGIDPLDVTQSIDAAGRYLKQLYQRFSSWRLALAAYNWGQGNVSRRPDATAWPVETQNYVSQISGDVNVA